MKALAYLLLIQVKNKILMLKKKPAFLVLYGIIIVFVLFSIVTMIIFGKDMPQTKFADERIVFLILAGLGLLFLFTFVSTGLSTGSSLFTMPDVGLLFVSPISSKKILFYGLISTLGKALIGSVFIFYQIGNLKTNFGYGLKEIFGLFAIFTVMILFCQLLSIGIYIFSNGNRARKRVIKGLLYALIGVLLLTALYLQRQEHIGIMEAVLRMTDASWFGYVPVTGWATMLFIGVVHNSMFKMIISLTLFLMIGIIIISLLTAGKADYYEDVLLSTEFTFQTKLAAKEGRNIPRQTATKIKVKDNDLGIGKGSGAMAFMYKHILELKRNSRFIFADGYTVFLMVGVGIAGYNFKTSEVSYYIVLAVVIYLQFFLTTMGKLKIELMRPFIYLIPENSLKKVFAASVTSLLKPCVDGICMFAVFGVFSGASIPTCIFFAFAYAASGAVFVGITILYQRVLGGQPNMIIQLSIGMGLLLAIMAPSVGVSIVAAILLPEALSFLSVLPYTVFCLFFAVLLFVTCGNLIDKAEYSGKA
ncbi:MAG TPA: putative ABC exporter domain-containing protein [Mobilitalea sp.]|nr:putative ABC exporter domain-containing protein [Mobilitalea sp.]